MATTNEAVVVTEDFKRDLTGRRIVSKERRAELVEAYRSSGLTMGQFAKREGINRLTLAKWSSLQRTAPRSVTFSEMRLGAPAAAWVYEVTLPNGLAVRAASAPALVQLLELVRK
jgi:transposase-like protein